jgi:hypothetical protein
MKTALAFSRGGRTVDFVVSSAAPTCGEVKAVARSIADNEVFFSLSVAPMLSKDGTERWGIPFATYYASSRGSDVGEVRISGEPNTAGPVALGLNLEIDTKAFTAINRPASKLVVAGDLVARGCGVKETDAKVRSQKNLTFSVAGKRFDVQGATLKPSDFPKPGHDLTLASQPFDCSGPETGTDVELRLSIGTDGKIQFAYMAGRVFSTQFNAVPGASDTLTVRPSGSFEGDGEIEISTSGQLDVLGFAVKLDGPLSATRCPK